MKSFKEKRCLLDYVAHAKRYGELLAGQQIIDGLFVNCYIGILLTCTARRMISGSGAAYNSRSSSSPRDSSMCSSYWCAGSDMDDWLNSFSTLLDCVRPDAETRRANRAENRPYVLQMRL